MEANGYTKEQIRNAKVPARDVQSIASQLLDGMSDTIKQNEYWKACWHYGSIYSATDFPNPLNGE